VSGYLHTLGVPAYQSGRILSFAALFTTLWLCWRILGHLTSNAFARLTGVILAASTANVLFWGSVGQTDMLACCFSIAAVAVFVEFRERGAARLLVLSGILVILAVFTKQSFLAAGATIGCTLLWEDRRLAAWWITAMSLAGGGIALALNIATHGGYFADAVLANINPFAWFKLAQHVKYLSLTGAGVLLIAIIGVRYVSRRSAPLYIYAAFATGVWLLTAPKIGSDLNYQIELMLVLSMCAASTLDCLNFYPSLFSGRRTWVTLLQLPLMLHVGLNLLLTGRTVAERAIFETYKGQETVALKPFVERPGRVFSGQYDSLVHYRGRIEVEPLIYSLLVQSGLTDPTPVTRDFEARRFATVILGGDVFAPAIPLSREALELSSLPEAQLEAIRRNYRLVKQVDGPNTVYIYEPRRD
jgi:hypothetical protein